MRELPTGTVTLLFTDIEGSTRLLDDLGDRYTEVLAQHRRAIHDAVSAHAGVEVSTEGDAVFAVFPRAADAVAAAAEAQRGLKSTPVRVRMGVHTGEPTLTPQGYVGLDVHLAARICAVGHGGQVVISETTSALLRGGFDLRDLGEHRLKDIDTPIRLRQLGRDEFPPLRTLSQARLPVHLQPLVGRKRELGELLRLLGHDGARLVTLTGPGGVGKTALAVAAAAELVESFCDGVALVELAAVRDPELVAAAIADAFGANGEPETQIGARHLLLVLDNLEQVIDAAGEIARVLSTAPNVSVLATSREPLRISGEREFPLRPLAEAPAVELFRQRAEAVLPDFAADYRELAEICRRLDSLPLAIELAAARVKVLPPAELLERLDRRLPILTGARRDVPERQRTLRETIEWSYELLTAEEQRLFPRLAVFSGGWTLEAAEAVCDADLDVLASLVDKSLVRTDRARFSMLETIREYAAERLEASGDADELRRRHAEYLAELAQGSERFFHGAEQAAVRERFRAERDNIRAALAWTLESGEIELGLRLAGSLTMAWVDQNVAPEAETWLRQLLERADGVEVEVRARALMTASLVAGIRNNLADAARWGQEAVEQFRAAGSDAGVAWSLTVLAVGPLEFSDPEAAGPMLAEAEELHRRLGDEGGLRRVLHLRGQQAVAVGDVDRGRGLLRESAELARAAGDAFGAASSLHSLGDVDLEAGDLDSAAAAYDDALTIAWETGADRLVCYCLAGLAATAAGRGDSARAAVVWGFVEAYEARLNFTMRRRERYDQRCRPAAAASPARYEEGRRLEVEAAVEIVGSRAGAASKSIPRKEA